MNPWERGTPLSKVLRDEQRADEGIAFERKAERYREDAGRVVHGEKLATLARGFVTGCGGKSNVTAEDCERFMRDHSNTVRKALDTVPDDDLPAAIYALVGVLDTH